MKYIQTNKAPEAVGPYAQAIVSNGFIFCSGQLGLDTKGVLSEGLAKQTHQVLTNLQAVLQEAGSDLDFVVKTTIYVTDIQHFAEVNNIYGEYFSTHKPARATVEVSNLPKGALIEIDAIAEVITENK